jgi:phage tail-like protein
MRSRSSRRFVFVTVTVLLGVGVLAAVGFGKGGTAQITAARYSITLDGTEIASFTHLTDLTEAITPTTYLSSDDQTVVTNKLPGALIAPTITLSRPMTADMTLNNWHDAVRQGNIALGRRSVSLTLYDDQGTPLTRYVLNKAWPSKLEITSTAGSKGEALTEEVTFVAEYMQRISP